MISAKQESDLRDRLEYLDEILVRSELGAMPDDYRFEFKPLWQQSDAEKATAENSRAQRDKTYYDMGAVTEGLIARELRERGTYQTMTNEDVELAEELAKEPDPEPVLPGALPGQEQIEAEVKP
jgi:hypothetical protein